ncbi:hypothetical protein [Winogradskyella sediminis]
MDAGKTTTIERILLYGVSHKIEADGVCQWI